MKRKIFKALIPAVILIVLLCLTAFKERPAGTLKNMIELAGEGSVSKIDNLLDESVHSGSALKKELTDISEGTIDSIEIIGTTYNSSKNLAVVDCTIAKTKDGKWKKTRNFYFFCLTHSGNWKLYDIKGYSKVNIENSGCRTADREISDLTKQNDYFND